MLFCFKLAITIKRATRLVGSIILAEAYGHFLQGCRAILDEKAALNVLPRRELKDCLTKLKPEEVDFR